MDSFSETNLIAEVRALIAARLSEKQPVPKSWIVTAVLSSHDNLFGSDRPFYLLCGHHHVGDVVRKVLSENKMASDSGLQGTLPGFDHIQEFYSIIRNGEPTLVPVVLMSRSEILAKVGELRTMSDGLLAHADELLRFADEQGSEEVTA